MDSHNIHLKDEYMFNKPAEIREFHYIFNFFYTDAYRIVSLYNILDILCIPSDIFK